MNLTLTYCWKEWRAQRGLLVAYTLLVFTCLCLGLYLAPRHYWFDEGFGVHALSWFVAAGCIGVIAFAVPNLVRAEFTSKDDQFVRRLPGALRPAFSGKLLFLVLVTAALPLLGLLFGELLVTARDSNWDGLFFWDWQGNVSMQRPFVVLAMAAPMLLLPWIWTVGMWLPGGRLALLGTTLLLLLLGVGLFAVMRQYPKIEQGVVWQSWLWTVPLTGLFAAAASWIKGRRGGGPLRSARHGMLALLIVLLPGAVWVGERVWRYRHPDMENLGAMSVVGMSPGGRYALAYVVEDCDWQAALARIDLETGVAQQVTEVGEHLGPLLAAPHRLRTRAAQRYWRGVEGSEDYILDLTSGERHTIELDREQRAVMPPRLATAISQQRTGDSGLSAPGGIRVRCGEGKLFFEMPNGTVEHVDYPFPTDRSSYVAGHGLRVMADGGWRYYGFAQRLIRDVRDAQTALFVGAKILVRVKGKSIRRSGEANRASWVIYHEDGEGEPCEALRNAVVAGLLDDERVLAYVEGAHREALRIFAFNTATGETQDVELPSVAGRSASPWTLRGFVSPMRQTGSVLPRDPANHVWLSCYRGGDTHCFRLHAESLEASGVPVTINMFGNTLLAWDNLPKVVHQDGLEIIETNIETGARRTLFSGAKQNGQ